MANWCSNTVVFLGEQDQIQGIARLFTQMAAKEQKEDKGQLPDFISAQADWFFSIGWEQDVLYYETKWSPNLSVVKAIADHFGVGFIAGYSETGNLVFGEATYENGLLSDTFLDNDDFLLFEHDEESDTYIFEDDRYASYDEILEILLERKKAIQSLAS
ncbi:hypothetical protein [Mucilaginibacter sp. UYCu711]|uniref:DUF1281 family ferredoxin-like fold protein n=1 Tax=Mucilaginibacter sp. UYCu711 TaxID=3156339 RepID=UPI003D254C8F